jgi:hypothetical protein
VLPEYVSEVIGKYVTTSDGYLFSGRKYKQVVRRSVDELAFFEGSLPDGLLWPIGYDLEHLRPVPDGERCQPFRREAGALEVRDAPRDTRCDRARDFQP